MASDPLTSLKSGFWKSFAGLAMVDDKGAVHLTDRGSKELRLRGQAYGLDPLKCRTLAEFLQFIQALNREESADAARARAFGLNDLSLSPENRAFIRAMLANSPSKTARTDRAPSVEPNNVVDFQRWKENRKPDLSFEG